MTYPPISTGTNLWHRYNYVITDITICGGSRNRLKGGWFSPSSSFLSSSSLFLLKMEGGLWGGGGLHCLWPCGVQGSSRSTLVPHCAAWSCVSKEKGERGQKLYQNLQKTISCFIKASSFSQFSSPQSVKLFVTPWSLNHRNWYLKRLPSSPWFL